MDSGRDWSAEINELCRQLKTYYIDRGVADRLVTLLVGKLTAGAYVGLLRDEDLAAAVTADMQSANGDLHLYLAHTEKELPPRDNPILDESPRDPLIAVLDGHGFGKAQRLAGNVGLLEMRRFWHPAHSGHAAIGLMNYLASTDALIIDLRHSGGGEPEMVALLESYLFDESTQLNSLYFPKEDRTIQFWTLSYVSGARFGGTKPLYVLTSSATFSAAEGFSYDLQQHGRATIIGERTAGGANFHFPMRVNDHLFSAVPSGYPIHPVSLKNWEGTGVVPQIQRPSEQAFDVAYERALEHVLSLGGEGARGVIMREATTALGRHEFDA